MSEVLLHDFHPSSTSLKQEVLAGLSSSPKTLPPKLFYDQHGAKLFEAICELPEYYLTRSEIAILERNAGEIAGLSGHNNCLIELGSGAGIKVRLLLEHLRPSIYVPIDISRSQLQESAQSMAEDYPWLEVHAVCSDYCQPMQLDFIPEHMPRLVYFPGSTLGNFDPVEAQAFLSNLKELVGKEGGLLISIDLKKDPRRINAAYNDRAGVTAAFNLNILSRLHRDLGAEVDLAGYRHQAFYDPEAGRVEMHLISRKEQTISIDGQVFNFAEGETIHTENSYKYSVDDFKGLATRSGYRSQQVWADRDGLFSIHFLRPA